MFFNPFHVTGLFRPENIKKTKSFMFSEGIERDKRYEMGKW